MPSEVAFPSANLDFAWDRPETADSLRERLINSSRSEWLRLAAWILREARVGRSVAVFDPSRGCGCFRISALNSVTGVLFGNTCLEPHMNWEDSKACTPLKRDFLREWFAQDQRFFLTGGSALGLFYLDHRRPDDLDLFTTETVEDKEVQNLVFRVSTKIGAHCTAIRSAPDFHRFKLTRGEDREVIDVVVDRAPQLDPLKACLDGIRAGYAARNSRQQTDDFSEQSGIEGFGGPLLFGKVRL
jgi:hypothetical protein